MFSMNSIERKKLIPPLILIVVALGFLIFNMFGSRQEESGLSQGRNPVMEILVDKAEELTVEGTSGVISLNFPEDFSSPFALLNDTATQSNSGINAPIAMQMPDNMPSFSTGFELPVMPDIGNNTGGAPGGTTILKAILYKPGQKNMAIVGNGSNETIVVEGSDSPWGYVSKITANKVILDNMTLFLDR